MVTEEQKENLTKWVEALNSGKYQQCRSRLIKDKGDEISYCCLGVAGKVIGLSIDQLHSRAFDFLDPDNEERLGIDLVQQHELAELNDQGKNFKTIAKRIVEMFDLQDVSVKH